MCWAFNKVGQVACKALLRAGQHLRAGCRGCTAGVPIRMRGPAGARQRWLWRPRLEEGLWLEEGLLVGWMPPCGRPSVRKRDK